MDESALMEFLSKVYADVLIAVKKSTPGHVRCDLGDVPAREHVDQLTTMFMDESMKGETT